MNAALDRLARFYETLERDTLTAGLAANYASDAYFKDPFNEVRGLVAIEAIFAHMFVQVQAPRFAVLTRAQNGADGFLTWEFHFELRGAAHCIRGATHVRFDERGKVEMHRDYWDAAEELYEKLPLLGALMRWLKRRANS